MCSPKLLQNIIYVIFIACGDGLRTIPELCDDNNLLSGDGCSKNCTIEKGFICLGGNST